MKDLISSFFKFNKTTRKWHLPVIAGLTIGIPLILGWYFDNIAAGKLASLASLSILYIQSDKLVERMVFLMICCFGITLSYTVGLLFSFNHFIAPFALGLFSFGVHYSLHKLQLTKPPGNFFFIMLAATAICTPFDAENVPAKIGYTTLGIIFTCFMGLIYSLLTLKKAATKNIKINIKNRHTNIVESLVFGLFMCISLIVAFSFKFDNPYWIPISCIAVMQGGSSKHTWTRGTQRIVGTLVGLGITWLIAYTNPSTLVMVISITILQIIIEVLVVRNYALAVIFITMMTIFLTESGNQFSQNTTQVFLARMYDILIGSVIGIIGGWTLYHEKVHYYTTLQIKKVNHHRKLKYRREIMKNRKM